MLFIVCLFLLDTDQGADEGAGEKKKRRGWGSGSAAPAALNTSMLKDIITATVTANDAADGMACMSHCTTNHRMPLRLEL
jgi:hypothetical protein